MARLSCSPAIITFNKNKMHYTEKTYISEFNVHCTGNISVRKTTDVHREGVVIASEYWRGVLVPDDPQAASVLGGEPYYAGIAKLAWETLPTDHIPAVEKMVEAHDHIVDATKMVTDIEAQPETVEAPIALPAAHIEAE